MAAELSREDVREELRVFAQKSLRRELKDFGQRLQRSICDELKNALAPGTPQLSARPHSTPRLKEARKKEPSTDEDIETRNSMISDLSNGAPLTERRKAPPGALLQPLDCPPPCLPGLANCDQNLHASGEDARVVQQTSLRTGPLFSSDATAQTLRMPVGYDLRRQASTSEVSNSSPKAESPVCRIPTNGSGMQLQRASILGASTRYSQDRLGRNAKRNRLIKRRSSGLFTPGEDAAPRMPSFFGFQSESSDPGRDQRSSGGGSPCRITDRSESCDGDEGQLTDYRRAALLFWNGKALWQCHLRDYVEHPGFDWTSGVLVIINAICIGLQTDYAATALDDHVPVAFSVLDRIFCVLFTAELALRLLAAGKVFFWGCECRWNAFDIVMVMTQIGEELTALLDSSGSGGSNFSYLRTLRILRTIRVLRIVRVLRFIRELRRLVCSIGSSLQSLAWTMVLIVFMLYVVGVCFTQLVTNYAGPPGVRDEALDRYFGCLSASVLSLFQIMSAGVDWDNVSRPLGEVHWVLSALCCIYIAFSVLAMMNVVTGVFVDSAIQSSVRDHEMDLVLRIRDFFERGDVDGTGKMSWEEFMTSLSTPGADDLLMHMGMSKGEAKHLFELLDVNDDGEINSDEFIMGCLRLRGPAKSVDVVTMLYDTKRSMGNLLRQSGEALQLLQAQQEKLSRLVSSLARAGHGLSMVS